MPLVNKLKNGSGTIKMPSKRNTPVWRGPMVDGITFSLLSRFLCCRERFRLLVIDGLKPAEGFNHRIEYGQMWHVCEEALAGCEFKKGTQEVHIRPLLEYCQDLCKKYPTQQQQIDHWYNVCKVQFPIYVDYWAKHPDVTQREPISQEQKFNVPYTLPSSRVVRFRGKFDSVDLIGKPGSLGIWLQENKTKGDIREVQLKRQVTFDLQTMMYLVALYASFDAMDPLLKRFIKHPIKGVRYNVIRRPLSGGKGTIVQHKPSKSNPQGESKVEFFGRVEQYIKEEPETYFMRWQISVTPQEVLTFRQQCLDPLLEQLCDWYEWITKNAADPFTPDINANVYHWRHPFGVYNVMDEGGSSDMDEYLMTGSEIGLTRIDNLFPEL